MEEVNSTYKCTYKCRSHLEMNTPKLPLHVHKMIVWLMQNQEDAKHLFANYEVLRAKIAFKKMRE